MGAKRLLVQPLKTWRLSVTILQTRRPGYKFDNGKLGYAIYLRPSNGSSCTIRPIELDGANSGWVAT